MLRTQFRHLGPSGLVPAGRRAGRQLRSRGRQCWRLSPKPPRIPISIPSPKATAPSEQSQLLKINPILAYPAFQSKSHFAISRLRVRDRQRLRVSWCRVGNPQQALQPAFPEDAKGERLRQEEPPFPTQSMTRTGLVHDRHAGTGLPAALLAVSRFCKRPKFQAGVGGEDLMARSGFNSCGNKASL